MVLLHVFFHLRCRPVLAHRRLFLSLYLHKVLTLLCEMPPDDSVMIRHYKTEPLSAGRFVVALKYNLS